MLLRCLGAVHDCTPHKFARARCAVCVKITLGYRNRGILANETLAGSIMTLLTALSRICCGFFVINFSSNRQWDIVWTWKWYWVTKLCMKDKQTSYKRPSDWCGKICDTLICWFEKSELFEFSDFCRLLYQRWNTMAGSQRLAWTTSNWQATSVQYYYTLLVCHYYAV